MGTARAEIVVDLAAIRHNVRTLRELAGTAMMTVVKADGYGHGLVESARAARDAGAEWLGVATLDEALALRAAGDEGRVLCWLTVPGEDYRPPIAADVDAHRLLGRGARRDRGRRPLRRRSARVQLKVDTGLSRGGAPMAQWQEVVARARRGEKDGQLDGHRHLVALLLAATSPTTPPTTPRRSCSARRSTSRHAAGLRSRGAAPGQLRGRDPAAERPARPGPLRHRVVRPGPGARASPRRSGWCRR